MPAKKGWIVYIDGAARGNPGPAAYAYLICHGDQVVAQKAETLGNTTNNVAEYRALIEALKEALRLQAERVEVRSDSQLLVEQMTGHYRVRSAQLRPLYEQAQELARRFAEIRFVHVEREDNRLADRLCNEVLDAAWRHMPATDTTQTRHTAPDRRTIEAPSRQHLVTALQAVLAEELPFLHLEVQRKIAEKLVQALEAQGVVCRTDGL
ncbi:MAG: hypothetical protein C4297_02270 [Gemmataceae bacterium]